MPLIAFWLACTSPRPAPVAAEQAAAQSLLLLEPTRVVLPPSSRPDGGPAPEVVPLQGPWQAGKVNSKGNRAWEMPLPFRPRGLFFHRAEPGMQLIDAGGQPLPYDVQSAGTTWSHDRETLSLFLPADQPEPAPGAFQLRYPLGQKRENRLNRAAAAVASDREFLRFQANDGWDNRDGLLLPAPGEVQFRLTVPAAGELWMSPGLVAPELQSGAGSSGARLKVSVQAGGAESIVFDEPLAVGEFPQRRADLSAFAGQEIDLIFRSDPGSDPHYDYVFLGEPAVASRKRDPRRVVLVFVDTLRPDHLGLYGYERPTSPQLDAWAAQATVFEQARTVAPWTLPSAQAAITGRHPEYYPSTPTLPARLREQGFATAMFAGNVYLSANFGMTRDWGLHRVGMWPMAEEVTDDALRWLDDHEGRDALLLVHYMDPHLPYKEPKSYRHLFAGDGCCGLREEFHLSDVKRAQVNTPEDRQYIIDRYDNNIRYATDQVARLLSAVDENDVVVFYADHGEEFWEHKGFEHGHTLFDELLRIPLIIKGPGLPAGARVQEPVSLLDLVPTVLDLLDLPGSPPTLDGQSLVAAAQGDATSRLALSGRDLAFGRPLYGTERWGVLHGTDKWTTNEGREALYHLDTDPGEADNVLRNDQSGAGSQFLDYLARGLGRPVPVSYRLMATAWTAKGTPPHDLVVTLRAPGGFQAAWVGDDPLDNSSATAKVLEDGSAEVRWLAGHKFGREVYVLPNAPVAEVTHAMSITVQEGAIEKTFQIPANQSAEPGSTRLPLARAKTEHRGVGITWGLAPLRTSDMAELSGRNAEVDSMLEAMGYQDPREDPAPGPPAKP